jgi:DNA polymerase-3 subunit beta
MALEMTVSKGSFLSALNLLQSVTSKKGTMAILSNILLKSRDKTIELTGTDLEVGVKVQIEAEIIYPGSITLPSKKLFEIVREAGSETINLEEQENSWVKISAGSSVYNMAGTSSDEYPDFPEYDKDKLFKIKSSIIKELIEKTIISVAQERESNYTLTGILIEKEQRDDKNFLRMVSSDGHRLSIMEKEVEEDISNFEIEKNIIIPRKGIMEIKKFCDDFDDISIGFEKNQAVVKSENSLIIIRLMNGDFPDYKNIINVIESKNSITIERSNFLDSLKRTNLFTEDTFNAIQFDIDNEKLVLTSQHMDYGNATDVLPVKYEGSSIKIGFNCKYFIDSLQVMKSEFVEAYISSDQSPCLIKGNEDSGFVSIIMPMKI